MNILPIVKYDGRLWFFDERLNELRDIYSAEPYRLDSGGLEAKHFKTAVLNEAIPVFDADGPEGD